MSEASLKNNTPPRRRKILQLVQNAMPGAHVVFSADDSDSISFRIRADNGQFRTGLITLLPHHAKIRLNRTWLERQIAIHGDRASA
jgi:hypothetical protein